MTGLLPPWVTLALSLWSIPMIALGITTIVCVWLVPRLRPNLPVIAPALLGLSCLLVAVPRVPRRDCCSLFFGALGPSFHLLWQFPLAVLIAVAIGRLSFELERRLLSLRRSGEEDSGLPPALQGFNIPSRGESMQGIAGIATRPKVFFALTAVTVIGEEALFRGVFLTEAFIVDGSPISLVLAVQAVLYALTHLAFGPQTIVSKAVLGIGLGLGAFAVGIGAAIIGHGVFQFWVYRQFEPLRKRPQEGRT